MADGELPTDLGAVDVDDVPEPAAAEYDAPLVLDKIVIVQQDQIHRRLSRAESLLS